MLSIIVPVYNVQSELERCVHSLIGQTYRDIEIILVDDGSSDGSGEICDFLAKSDSRIVVLHKVNGGLSSARNAGLAKCRGDWLLFVDSDDYIDLDTCERFMQKASATQADIIVGEAIQEFEYKSKALLRHGLREGYSYTSTEFISIVISQREFYAPVCFNCYSRLFWDKLKLHFTEGLLHEDMEIQPRLFLNATKIVYMAKPFYHYVVRDGSIMNTSNRERRIQSIKEIYTAWKKQFDALEDAYLQRLLYGHLAKSYLWSCRTLCDSRQYFTVNGIDWYFLFRYGLDLKEKIKALLFTLLCLNRKEYNLD